MPFNVDTTRVMTTKELLYANVRSGDPVYDKIFASSFITGAVEEVVVNGQKRWALNLDGAPIVVLKEKMKSELGLHPDTPTVDSMRALGAMDIGRGSVPYGNYSLVSGGAIIYYDNKLLCLKRDRFAPADPNCLTTPAGRMSEWLSTMSALELAEEIIIVVKHNKTGKLMTIGGYREGMVQLGESDILVQKQRQISKMLEFMSEKSREEAKVLEQIKGIDDILMINLNKFATSNMVNEKADQVFTFDNYQIKDQCSGFVFFDKKSNTLEFREVFDLTLPGFSLHSIMPGEYFQPNPTTKVINDTQILSKEELLLGLKDGSVGAVPTLKAYLEGLKTDQVINFFGKAKNF